MQNRAEAEKQRQPPSGQEGWGWVNPLAGPEDFLAGQGRHVLVTRPQPGLGRTMAALKGAGWQAVAAPALAITPVPAPGEGFWRTLLAAGCKAVALTSAQALPFLANAPRTLPLWVVGVKTAYQARQAGFGAVVTASGTAQALAQLCRQHGLVGGRVRLLTGRGDDGTLYNSALAGELQAERLLAYSVSHAQALPERALALARARQVHAAVFYSSESVRAFLKAWPGGESALLRGVEAWCLSSAIAGVAAPNAPWGQVAVMTDAP
ncbi:uroporphyrinogen-III synthase [Formicincola oecophyllae]|uniref:Uroporphyrinogen-III synthase n=1 Tax=Formicincola oecophyllae TaxID=2558361 RepID=A0A4Y6U8Y3_9PROT|nr:uroporphyrinogen-III synthase [Formicincola oecophyllae]QDH13923.1 uroporphyrinogen-III synthase [Formicincola oecophyllae]